MHSRSGDLQIAVVFGSAVCNRRSLLFNRGLHGWHGWERGEALFLSRSQVQKSLRFVFVLSLSSDLLSCALKAPQIVDLAPVRCRERSASFVPIRNRHFQPRTVYWSLRYVESG